MGVPLILMIVFTSGMVDPYSALAAGIASSPFERIYLEMQQLAKWVGLAAPAAFGLLAGAVPLMDRLSAKRR